MVGTLLGDACLQKTGQKNARLRLEQGVKQKDYLFWKVSRFPKVFLGKPKYLERLNPKSGKIYGYWRIQSNSTPFFGKWRRIFYPNGQKVIPSNLKDFLKHPLALAVWYMDDGYFYQRDKVSYLYLGRTSRQEAEVAQVALADNFALSSLIKDKHQKGFALYFSPQSTKELSRLIRPFIVSGLMYKVLV